MKRKRDREVQEKILETLKDIETNLITIFGILSNFIEETKTYQTQVLEDLKENE